MRVEEPVTAKPATAIPAEANLFDKKEKPLPESDAVDEEA